MEAILLLLLLLLLFPLALQTAMGFGLSNNTSPFVPIYHQLSPSSHSQHLKISFYFFSPSFPGSSSSSRPFQFLSEKLFGHMEAILLLLPLALQTAVGFGLSNNTSPFVPIYHQLSPSSHSQNLKTSFHFSPSFLGSSSSSRPFQFLSEDLFLASYPPPFSPGDPANLSFAPLSILLYFLLYSTLLVLDSPYYSIPHIHI